MSAGPDRTRELRDGCGGVGNVAQQVSEADGVEGLRRVWKFLGASRLERDAPGQVRLLDAGPTTLEHRVADVDAGDAGVSCGSQRDRHSTGPGGNVENGAWPVRAEMAHQLSPPSPVLPKGKNLGQRVVARRQAFEQLDGECVVTQSVQPTLSQTCELLTNSDLDRDARRFQKWQLDALDARRDAFQLLSLGPFRAVVPGVSEPGRWVTIVEGPVTERDTSEAVAKLRSVFEHHADKLEIEYDEVAFPEVGPWLEAAGLERAERNPLMACRPNSFKPFAAPDVTVSRLTTKSPAADIGAFQTIRWTNGGDNDDPIPSAGQLRQHLESRTSVHVLAWLDAVPAGTGVSHALKGAAEIVGIVTRADKRRRGVAATVTSELVTRHFGSGGDFVFLDAADEGAVKLYEGVGFETFGTNSVYR